MTKKRKTRDNSDSPTAASGHSGNVTVQYDALPADQQIQFVLNDEVDVLFRYNGLLHWIRGWVSGDGPSFEGINPMRPLKLVRGYPVIEVEIVFREFSSKFLISRSSAYILAFFSRIVGWRSFLDGELTIEGTGFKQMRAKATYSKSNPKPWEYVGPKEIISALKNIDSVHEETASKACQIFMVHLCEASRDNLLQVTIGKCLTPSPSAFWEPSYGDELQLVGTKGLKDVVDSLKPIVVNLNVSVKAPPEIEHHIKKYRQLSEAWYLYVLTNKRFCPLSPSVADECGIANVRSLRYSLAVLCNINLKKLYETWQRKFRNKTCPPEFKLTKEDLKVMKTNIDNLYSELLIEPISH